MRNQLTSRCRLSLSEKVMLLGIVLIVATSFPVNAQITRLFPVKTEISSRALEDTPFNEPYSEKIVYPLPPGVARPQSTESPGGLTTNNILNVSSTTPLKAPITTTDKELIPNDANLSKTSEPIAQEILPKESNQQDIIQFKLESSPRDELSPSTKGPLISDEINFKKSTPNVADLVEISEETIAPVHVQVAVDAILPIEKLSTPTETIQVKQELTTDEPLIKETIQTTQALINEHKETTLITESTTGTQTLLDDIKTTPSPVIPTSKSCTTPIGKTGECKDIRQCPSLLKLLMREPLLVENKLYLQRSHCGFEDENVLTCCPDNVPPPTVSSKWSLLPKPRFCGTMHENRLYGGPQTEIDSYSWMALLEYSIGGNKTDFHCGGALINDRYVVTAAHCVTGLPENWSIKGVRLGEWDVATTMDCSKFNDFIDCSDPHINVSIDEVIPHKDYVPASMNKLHDIALLRLSIPIISTDFIEPICLPRQDQDNLHAFDDQSLDLVGWGASADGDLFNNIKQKATAQVIQLNKCRSKYVENNVTLEQSQFCVEGRVKNDTCRIDSGGPVISFDTSNQGLGNYYLAGIQSFGLSPCWADDGLPGVYTRVGNYIDWILENINF